MKRATDSQDTPLESTKKLKSSTSGTVVHPDSNSEESPTGQGDCKAAGSPNSPGSGTNNNGTDIGSSSFSSQQKQADIVKSSESSSENQEKRSPSKLQTNGDSPEQINVDNIKRMEKIVAATSPRGLGFGSNNFAFFNGFAIPLQTVGPSLPAPGISGMTYRHQLGFQMNGNCRFPRPQAVRQQQIQSTVAASIVKNSEGNHIINPSSPANSNKANKINDTEKAPSTKYQFSQPWPSQDLLPRQVINVNEQSACNFSEVNANGDRDVKWRRIFQCCHCNSTNVREILVRSHNYCPNLVDDPFPQTKTTTTKASSSQSQIKTENSPIKATMGSNSDFNPSIKSAELVEDVESSTGKGIKRKRGYGILDDYVLDGKFVDAQGNPSDNENDADDSTCSPPMKKKFSFFNCGRDSLQGRGVDKYSLTKTKVVPSFLLQKSSSSTTKGFTFPLEKGHFLTPISTSSRPPSLGREIASSLNAQGSGLSQPKKRQEQLPALSRQNLGVSASNSNSIKLLVYPSKNGTTLPNIDFTNNSPVLFETSEQSQNNNNNNNETSKQLCATLANGSSCSTPLITPVKANTSTSSKFSTFTFGSSSSNIGNQNTASHTAKKSSSVFRFGLGKGPATTLMVSTPTTTTITKTNSPSSGAVPPSETSSSITTPTAAVSPLNYSLSLSPSTPTNFGISSPMNNLPANPGFSFGLSSPNNSNFGQRQGSVENILFTNGNPCNGFSSQPQLTFGGSPFTSTQPQAFLHPITTTIGTPFSFQPRFAANFMQPQQQQLASSSHSFSQFPVMSQVPNTFNFLGTESASFQQQQQHSNGLNTLFQFQGHIAGQGIPQDYNENISRHSPRRIRKGIRRLKRN